MEYTLTFQEVLDEIFDDNKISSWYQGENFRDGYILIREENRIKLGCFSEYLLGMHIADDLPLTKGLISQKYRRVYTQPDAMRKV